MATILNVATKAFQDQKPGTSGLRKKVKVFQTEHYLENFVQGIFDVLPSDERDILVLGGDGRYHNLDAAQSIIRVAAGNGVRRVVVGKDALLSTPAASAVIRKHGANGGIVLSASHNPGGPDADFGIKFNNASGAPANETFTNAVFEATKSISQYRSVDSANIDLGAIGKHVVGETHVDVIDPVEDYAELMARCFDFDRLAKAFSAGRLSIVHDAMHAITGPYARRILVETLGAGPDAVINAEPLEDFGGGHPDPNLAHAKALVELMYGDHAPLLGSASDGDGDRNMILGRSFFVSPSDSLAVLTANAERIPQFCDGIPGVARSMPTSAAVDRVAEALGIECYVTPTGWKFFGNLLDAGRIRLCGEESFGTGGDHVREKDGLWTVLAWLSVVEALDKPVAEILKEHWQRFGRNYYCRHDFEAVESDAATALFNALAEKLSGLNGQTVGALTIEDAVNFGYEDPVDGSKTEDQGIEIYFAGGSRCAFRLSGTGTEGATIRLYLERYEAPNGDHGGDAVEATRDLLNAANALAQIEHYTGRTAATVIT